MTDYEGLGTTDRRHPYLLGVSETAGVLDIVRAARRLFGARICSRFANVGDSQGGQVALFTASPPPPATSWIWWAWPRSHRPTTSWKWSALAHCFP